MALSVWLLLCVSADWLSTRLPSMPTQHHSRLLRQLSYACTCLSQRDLSHLNLPEAFFIRKTSTKHLFHQKGFTPKSKALLHHEAFTPATLYTRSLLHQKPFTYCINNYLYTSETFYTKPFISHALYTEASYTRKTIILILIHHVCKQFLHQQRFTQKVFRPKILYALYQSGMQSTSRIPWSGVKAKRCVCHEKWHCNTANITTCCYLPLQVTCTLLPLLSYSKLLCC